MLNGIDISHYQGKPDFDKLRNNTEFIILKASEGITLVDAELKRNQLEARRVGLGVGYYHFARPEKGNSAAQEVDWFLKAVGNLRDGEILVLDFEVSFTNAVDWCFDFLNTLAAKTNGTKALIYMDQNRAKIYNWKKIIDAGYGLWIAKYDNTLNNNAATPWPFVAMKQYTSTGKMDGITGNVDLDVFYGDLAAFKRYGYKTPVTPPNETPQPILQITEQTRIPQIVDEKGNAMEVQAIKSTIDDLRKNLLSMTTDRDAWKAKHQTLVQKIRELPL